MRITPTTITRVVEEKFKGAALELTLEELAWLRHFIICGVSDKSKLDCAAKGGFDRAQQFVRELEVMIGASRIF